VAQRPALLETKGRRFGLLIVMSRGTVIDCQKGESSFMEAPLLLSGSVEVAAEVKGGRDGQPGPSPRNFVVAGGAANDNQRARVEGCELALFDLKKFRFMVEMLLNFVWFVMEEL